MLANVPSLSAWYLRTKARSRFLSHLNKRYHGRKILPDTNVRGKKRKASWRYARKNDTYYYDYERIPSRSKKGLPATDEVLKIFEGVGESVLQDEIRGALRTAFQKSSAFLPAYGSCTEAQAKALARACTVIDFAAEHIKSHEPTRSLDLYRHLATIIAEERWEYLPKNHRVLKQKIDLVVHGADVRKVIKLPRQGNQNRSKYDNKRVRAWLLYLRSDGRNYTNRHIYRKVKRICELEGEKAPSLSWVEHFLGSWRNKFLTAEGRFGSGKYAQGFTSYVPLEGALHPGDCWEMDGTRVQLVRHRDANGDMRSLNMITVRDVHSGDVLGYHFDYAETHQGYIHALEMAVAHTGHLPWQLVHDKFPGHNTTGWQVVTERITHMGTQVKISSKATHKAAAERGFGTLQQVFAIDSKWYYGEGIMSNRKTAHVSPEHQAKMARAAKRENFDYDAAWREAADIIERYRHTKYSEYSRVRTKIDQSPFELYRDGEHDNVYACDDFRRVEIFGTETQATLRNNGKFKIDVQKVTYTYQLDEIEQYDIIAKYRKVNVCYDIADLTRVYLFEHGTDVNREYLGEAVEERRLIAHGPKAEFEKIAKAKAKHKQLRERRKRELDEQLEPAGDMEVLMSAATDKRVVGAAEDNWLAGRIEHLVNHEQKPRLAPEPAPEPADYDEYEDVDLDLIEIPRNY